MVVVPCLSDIPDPFRRLVIKFVLYAKIPHSQTTPCEHGHLQEIIFLKRGYLKVDRDRRLVPLFVCFEWCHYHFSAHHKLHITLELLYAPHYRVLLWLIFGLTRSCWVDLNIRWIWGHWHFHYDISGKVSPFKYGLKFDTVLKLVQFREPII